MPAFLADRPDVVYKSVTTFSGSKRFSSRDEMKTWQDEQAGIRERYDLDYSPRIYILNPDGSVRVGGDESGQAAYRFMREWMEGSNGSS